MRGSLIKYVIFMPYYRWFTLKSGLTSVPYVARRTVYRDENGKLTSHALPHQFVVLYVTSNDSSAVCSQDSHNSERNLSVLVVIAISLLIAQSNA